MTDPQFFIGLFGFIAIVALTISHIVLTMRVRELTEDLDRHLDPNGPTR